MRRRAAIIRLFVVAAFLAATLLPGMLAATSAQQRDTVHDRMMAMAGHAAPVEIMLGDHPSTPQIMLCKQKCLVAAAILPLAVRPAVIEMTFTSLPRRSARMFSSLSIAPPGRPPKGSTV